MKPSDCCWIEVTNVAVVDAVVAKDKLGDLLYSLPLPGIT